MIKSSVANLINKQINAELGAAYLYYGMACWFDENNWYGMASWMKKQAGEEVEHADKFRNYLIDRDGTVDLTDIGINAKKWKSPLEIFEAAYVHECKVTKMICDIVALARKEGDMLTESFLKWFLDEQVEEEATAKGIVDEAKRYEKDLSAMFALDKRLGKRKGEDEEEDKD